MKVTGKLCFRGTAIAAAVSNNVLKGNFDSRVHIYVYDELIRSTLLSEVINKRHENVKYLPGIKLPRNLVAVSDLLEAAQNADILIFSTPQSFVESYCNILAGNLKETAFAVSMIKGLMKVRGDEMGLVSHAIQERLDIPCYSMVSAHSAMEMAQGKLCEITLGCNDRDHAQLLTTAFQTNNCRVIAINDVDGVELCGTLKDIIALGAGFADGLRLGENARVTAIHLGLKEMMRFIKAFFPSAQMSTFYESCGVANSVASTYVDKNVTFAKSFVTTGQTIQEIEANLLNGRKLLGPIVAAEVNALLEKEEMEDEFPLFTAIHRICQNESPPEAMIEAIRSHPDLSNASVSHLLNDEAGGKHVEVLDEFADTLPKLRSALEKILSEADNKNLKNLKVLDVYRLEDLKKYEKASEDQPIETEDVPGRLSENAAKIEEDIRQGNVQIAFKMDVEDNGRQMHLFLEEMPGADREFQSVISFGSDSEKKNDMSKVGNSLSLESSEIPFEHDTDALDWSSNSKSPRGLEEETMMYDPESYPRHTAEVAQIESESTGHESEEQTLQAQEDLIKSIRKTIQALDDETAMQSLIAESKLEEEKMAGLVNDSSYARSSSDQSFEDEDQLQQHKTKLSKESDSIETRFQDEIKGVLEEEPDSKEKGKLRDKGKLELLEMESDPIETRFQDEIEGVLEEEPYSDEKGRLGDLGKIELLAKESDPIETRFQDEIKGVLEEEPDSDEKGKLGDKGKLELLEMESDPIESRFQDEIEGDHHDADPIQVRAEESKTPNRLQLDAQDMDDYHDAEVLAESRGYDGAEEEKRATKLGERKPHHSLDEVNSRYYSKHEWDWLLNNDQIDMETKEKSPTSGQDETLSKADQEKLDKLSHQLKEALMRDVSSEDVSSEDVTDEKELEPEAAKKRDPREFEVPLPAATPAFGMPSEKPVPQRKPSIREGSPQIEPQPSFVPPPAPHNKPPAKQLNPRQAPPAQFEFPEALADLETKPHSMKGDQRIPESKKRTKAEPPVQSKAGEPPARKAPIEQFAERRRPPGDDVHRKSRGDGLPPQDRPATRKEQMQPEPKRRNVKESSLDRAARDMTSSVRRGQDRQVDFKGSNPFDREPGLDTMDTSSDQPNKGRKVGAKPPFNPPINPRVRVPGPPFDGREREFHTLTYSMAPAIKWPRISQNLQPTRTLVATVHMKNISGLPRQVQRISKPAFQMPLGVPRSPTLTKILCALQIGLLASYLTRFRKK
ncbi:hypothetical protein KR009_007538 [Drosophila setifemur]|nr:hypothetical protein KR009_007538 [Drosophila setifemur]